MAKFLTRFNAIVELEESPSLDQGEGDSLENDLILLPEENNLVLTVTEDQYIRLLSAAMNGAQVTYPDDYLNVIYPLIKAGKLDFCQTMADCITDPNSPAYAALQAMLNEAIAEALRDAAQSQSNTNLAAGTNPECDYDTLFGQCLQLVEYLNGVNEDAFQKFEAQTNVLDFAADVIGDVTGVDEVSMDAILAWAAFLQEGIYENYEAQITQAYLEERACEIFCLAIENGCVINPDTLWTVWADRLSATVTIGSLLSEALTFLVTGTWIGEEIADVMFFSQLAFRSLFGRFIGLAAYYDLLIRLRVYSNDPNPDWAVLCEDCEPFCVTYDFTIDDAGFEPAIINTGSSPATIPAAQYETAQGWTSYGVPVGAINPRYAVRIYRDSIPVNAKFLDIEATNTVARTIGIYISTVDSNGDVVEQIFGDEGFSFDTGDITYRVNLPNHTPAAGYRVDLRDLTNEMRVSWISTAYTFCGEEIT